MRIQILFSSKQMQMGRYKWLILFSVLCAFCSCKKQVELVDPEIAIENVYVEFIKSNQVDINYKLSHVGYQATGVSYYKKTEPATVILVNAVRESDLLKLSLQGLEANTEYVFKVFYKQNNEQKADTKEYTVKTLTAEMAKFALEVKSTGVNYDEKGNFTLDIEGENINNLNLSELDIKVNQAPVTIGYPTLLSNKRYKITIKGTVNPVNGNNSVQGLYQGKEILFQTIPFVFDGDRYWLTAQLSATRGYYASVFNNELYYFYNKQVFKWNDTEQRLSATGSIQEGTIDGNVIGFQFDGQLFFRPVKAAYSPNQNDISDYYNYPEIYSYSPGTNKWSAYSFKEQKYVPGTHVIGNNNYFVHKGELYVAYSLNEDGGAVPNAYLKSYNFIYHYNRLTKQFESAASLAIEIINFHFISINNQLYLTGLVPVYDQGFKVSATFAVFKVDDNFKLQEVYRGGTVAQPLTFFPSSVIAYDQKILIVAKPDDFKLFDPSDQKLYQVFLKNNIPNIYLGGFFNYNNKLYLNGSQTSYEISIVKGR